MSTNLKSQLVFIWLGGCLIVLSLAIFIGLTLSDKILDQRLFYLILLLFGVGISALIFGVMKSLAKLTGRQDLTDYSFSGPIVGVILVVIGYFYFNPTDKIFSLQFNVFGANRLPVRDGKLTVYIDDVIEKPISSIGQVQIQGVPQRIEGELIRCIVIADGYEPYINDSILVTQRPVDLYLTRVFDFIITGKILTAADIPISDAEVNIKNTPYTSVTRPDGGYTITVKGFKSDRLFLVTSHENYQDKEVEIELSNQSHIRQDFIIAPNTNPTGSYQ